MLKKLSLSFLLTVGLSADYIAVFNMNGSTQTLLYKNAQHAKMITNNGNEKSSFYLIGEKSYIVSEENGRKTVMDMDEMRNMTKAFGAQEGVHQNQKKKNNFKIIKTNKHETVAGIRGDVWYIVNQQEGKKYRVVVTNNSNIKKTLHVVTMFMNSFADTQSHETDMFELQNGYVVIKADGMELKKFKKKSLPAKTYTLPANVQQQSMPNFATLFGGGSKHQGSSQQNTKGLVDKCYEEVCCGSTAGDSKVLIKMLAKQSAGYQLQGSGVCDVLGVSSVFGVDNVEGALYKKSKDAIQVTLAMHSKEKSVVLSAKKGNNALQAKNYQKGTIDGHTYYYALLSPVKQQEMDIIINPNTMMKITRHATKNEINLISWAKHAIHLDKYSVHTQSKQKTSSSQERTTTEREAINKNVDKAVDMLKNLF